MNKFLVILSDIQGTPDYLHPSEIFGKNKAEIQNLVKETVPAENIINIFTVDEYNKFINSKQFKAINSSQNINSTNSEDGNSFMENMIQKATQYAEIMNESTDSNTFTSNESTDSNTFISNESTDSNTFTDSNKNLKFVNNEQNKKNSVKYFIDNGIQFKLENGQLFKKIWETVPITEYLNNSGQKVFPEFRIINKETKKPIKSTKFEVQQLVWKPLENN